MFATFHTCSKELQRSSRLFIFSQQILLKLLTIFYLFKKWWVWNKDKDESYLLTITILPTSFTPLRSLRTINSATLITACPSRCFPLYSFWMIWKYYEVNKVFGVSFRRNALSNNESQIRCFILMKISRNIKIQKEKNLSCWGWVVPS